MVATALADARGRAEKAIAHAGTVAARMIPEEVQDPVRERLAPLAGFAAALSAQCATSPALASLGFILTSSACVLVACVVSVPVMCAACAAVWIVSALAAACAAAVSLTTAAVVVGAPVLGAAAAAAAAASGALILLVAVAHEGTGITRRRRDGIALQGRSSGTREGSAQR
jgi:hypothetical protein